MHITGESKLTTIPEKSGGEGESRKIRRIKKFRPQSSANRAQEKKGGSESALPSLAEKWNLQCEKLVAGPSNYRIFRIQ